MPLRHSRFGAEVLKADAAYGKSLGRREVHAEEGFCILVACSLPIGSASSTRASLNLAEKVEESSRAGLFAARLGREHQRFEQSLARTGLTTCVTNCHLRDGTAK